MAYIRTNRYLKTESGMKFPARISDITLSRADAIMNTTIVSHTSSIPFNDEIVNDSVLTDDKGYRYRVIEWDNILGKMRLRLERL